MLKESTTGQPSNASLLPSRLERDDLRSAASFPSSSIDDTYFPNPLPSETSAASERAEESAVFPEALSLRDIERSAIINALHRWEGNRTRAAEELGISRRTLHRKLALYDIQ